MEVLGLTFTVWTILQSVVLLWLFTIIYDWIQVLAWKRKYKVKGPFPFPLVGTFPYIFFVKDLDKAEEEYHKSLGPLVGSNIGSIKVIKIGDVNLLKKIMIKEHVQFQNRYTLTHLDPWPIPYTLLSLKDAHWKRARSIVTPTFSASKIKKMTQEINYCADLLTAGLLQKAMSGDTVDSRKHFGCYSMDVIASTAFGIRTDSYSNPDDPFVALAQKVFGQSPFGLKTLFAIMFPNLALFLTKVFKFSAYYPLDSMKFFTDVIKKIIKERQDTGDTERVDLLQLMLNAELQGEVEVDGQSKKKLSLDEVLGQGVIVFVAGYETTASLLGYVSYVLATHPEIQGKLLAEIDAHIHSDVKEIQYDVVMEMPYLDQVINETLRMYPPINRMNRTTSKNQDVEVDGYWFPGDAQLSFSIWQLHHTAEFYPEPETFKPERFSQEEKAKRDPFVFMPFGQGPRNCIGMRLALLEAKIAVVAVLRKMKFVKCDQTEIPLELNRWDAFVKPMRPIKVGVQLR